MTLTRNLLFCLFFSIILASEDYYPDKYYEEKDLASLPAETIGEKREEGFSLQSENPASNFGTEPRPEVKLHCEKAQNNQEETIELKTETVVPL